MKKIKLISILLALALGIPCFASCSPAPELDTVKQTFIDLIEASVEVNDIFFGEGLPTYPRLEGDGNLIYNEEYKTYYMFIADGDRVIVKYQLSDGSWAFAEKRNEDPEREEVYKDGEGNFYYSVEFDDSDHHYVYTEDSPENYDYVRLDCPYQKVKDIQNLAETVYSAAYLKGDEWQEGDLEYSGVYSTIFDGMSLGTQIVYARYRADDSADGFFLLKYNEFEPLFEKHTTYDYDSMKIIKPSKAELVNIEITATGRYIDLDSLEVKYGEYTKTLRFVMENGEWRLDTPTY